MRVRFCLPEDENSTQVVRQRPDRALQVPSRIVGRPHRPSLRNSFVKLHFTPPPLGAQPHQCQTCEYTLEPPNQTPTPVVLVYGLRQADEEIVENILGILHRGREPPRKAKQRRPMQSIEVGESVGITARDSTDQIRVYA
ncbi:MAG TPA: hypothetical protein VK467_07890 [Gemmatimonadales bacterium]|nr:hypothetical protein [Gemmatimonadales bacterium]